MKKRLRHYLQLTKPGIVRGNLIAAAAGFFLASQGQIDWLLLLAVCVGTVFIVASGCVFNNFIDKDIDALMQRTRQRELVRKIIPESHALILALVLGVVGFFVLYQWTTLYAFAFGVLGYVVYLVFYSLHYKRKSVYGTLIGSLSGACPPVIGYYAVTNSLDAGGAVLFLTFCIWQIPHSYAIAIYRFNDYKAASIPVLPVRSGITRTRYHMMGYIAAFGIAALTLNYLGYVGGWYALGMGLVSLYWLYITKVGYQKMPLKQWGRRLTGYSIVSIMAFCLLISIDFVAPQTSQSHLALIDSFVVHGER